jgi:cation:H+ antiporter
LEGVILVLSLIAYVWYEIYYSKKKVLPEPIEQVKEEKKEKKISLPVAIIFVIVSAAGLALGADLFVNGATAVARMLNISERVISLTLVAVGTSLPELFASIIAAFKKEAELSVGNVIGSNIFNIFSIIGITAIIKPMNFDFNLFFRDLIWMAAIGGLLFLAFFPLKTRFISRFEGTLMLVAYIVYVILLF